ncbi:MAG: DUF262 domain-containing protein [Prevotella sp.]|nr:DUF262 domain-containing protein [Prevotella sp.]
MRDATRICDYFYGAMTLFIIPLYQRKYAWQQKHCVRLFEDLKKIHRQGIYSHFFGSIVASRVNEVDDDLLIIDGQQRITTLSLLILAGLNAVANNDMEKGDEDIEEVRKNYLYAVRRRVERKIKLKPIEGDLEAYDALFSNNLDEFIKNSGITSNYLLFYQMIKASDLSFKDLIGAIEKLTVIDIRLDSKDNPQLIFESLNSCGKDLEEADKVRNYLLMSLSPSEQEEYYRSYWSKIEKMTDGEPTMFIRDYLTIEEGIISNIEDLYFDFKKYDEERQIERRKLLEMMLKYARYYRQITKGETGNKRIDRKLKQIANIGTTVHLPFFMSFFDYAENNALSEDEIYEVLDVIENFWARRIICNYPANALQKMFAILHNDILKIYKRHEKRGIELTLPYSQILKHVLLRKQGTAAFPENEEIIKEFPIRQIYRIPSSYRCFLFERMENENSPEANDTIVAKMQSGEFTIEHIMPQTLTPQWKLELGENWEDIYNAYLHTFGNLTLTGFNVSYSNHSFMEKKEGYIDRKGNKIDGFDNSAFRLSNYLKHCSKWTLDEILERQNNLLNNFLHLWPMIKSDYIPLEKEYELVSFDDDEYELTGRTIQGFRYRDERHSVITWKDMLVMVCKLMYNENPSTMTYLATKNYWIHETDGKDKTKIADQCYVYSSCSTNTKRSILNYLFMELGIPSSVLEFELAPLADKVFDSEGE